MNVRIHSIFSVALLSAATLSLAGLPIGRWEDRRSRAGVVPQSAVAPVADRWEQQVARFVHALPAA